MALPKPTPESILALVQRYKPLFEDSWNRMEREQAILDGRNPLMKNPPSEFVEFHSPILRGRVRKIMDRTVTWEPKVRVEPRGVGDKAKAEANRLEPELSRWLEGMTARLSRPPWRELDRLIEERGKGVVKGPLIASGFTREPPERQKDESAESYTARAADYESGLAAASPFVYEAVDPLWSVIHPPTLGASPPWVIQLSRMDIFEVMERWPFWTDPQQRLSKQEHESVDLVEYVQSAQMSNDGVSYRCMIADGQPVSHTEKSGRLAKEGGVIPNIYRDVFYRILYSPYGGIGPLGEPGGSGTDVMHLGREERLAVSLVRILQETTVARDRLLSFMQLYLMRYGLPLFYSGLTTDEFNRQAREGHFHVPPGTEPPALVQQQPLPAFLTDLVAELGAQEDFVSIPPIGAGVRTPGTTSGYQDANLLQQVDLATIDTREAVARAMEQALSRCCFIVKHVMDAETASRATDLPLGIIPDAPRIIVDMEPPDESKKARRLAMAKSIENHLDEETFLTEAGYEDAGKIIENKRLDALVASEQIAFGIIVPEAIRIWQLQRAASQAEEAASAPVASPPPGEPVPVEPGTPEAMEPEMVEV